MADDRELREAILALQEAENAIAAIDRAGVRKELQNLLKLTDSLPQLQHTLRMSRIRFQARLSSDPDKTPVRPPSVHDLSVKQPK